MVAPLSTYRGFARTAAPLACGATRPALRALGARRLELQRLFSGFPDGPAGLGLLLLRVTVGSILLVDGWRSAASGLATSTRGAADVLALVAGFALLTGAFTPAASALGAAVSLWRALVPAAANAGLASGPSLALLVVMAATVGLMGPGGYSVDARLFGRREIVVPRAGRDRRDSE